MSDKITIAVTVPAGMANRIRDELRTIVGMFGGDPDLVCCVEGEAEVVKLLAIRDAARAYLEAAGLCGNIDAYEHDDMCCDDPACEYCNFARAVDND